VVSAAAATGALQAEQRLANAQQAAGSASESVNDALKEVAQYRIELLDPKSAVVVAVRAAESALVSLQKNGAPDQQVAVAQERVDALLEAVGSSSTISVERILNAQQKLAELERDATATPAELAEARAEVVQARVPTLEEVAEILDLVDSSESLPVIIPGVVDAAGGGQALIFDNASAVKTTVTRINKSAVQLRSTDNFVLTIAAVDRRGVPFQINSRGAVVVKHGNYISVSGEGFAPGTVATTWLFSSPRVLGDLAVDDQGRFSSEFRIEDDVKIGDHVAQVNGLTLSGEERSVNIDVEILANERVAPYDPLSEPANVVDLTAQALVLLAALGATAARRREQEDDDVEQERDSAEVAEVSVAMRSAKNDRERDAYLPPRSALLDRWSFEWPGRLVPKSPLLARVSGDPSYLRALFGWLWLVVPAIGVAVGFAAARSTGFEAIMPSLALCLALVVVGTFDSLAGFFAVSAFSLSVLVAGGIDSTDAIRGLLGLAVFGFAVPLAASAVRPFRRVDAGVDDVWNRLCDAVLNPLFGAWSAGAMFAALPGLTGFKPEYADEIGSVRLVVLLSLVARWLLENAARIYTPKRLDEIENDQLPFPSQSQQLVSAFVRTAVFIFVAVVFIGNNWALWVGGVLYLVPKLVALVNDNFPHLRTVHRYLPRGLFRVVLMLFVAKWWGGIVADRVSDPANMVMIGFVLLGLPGLALTITGWFARESKPWRSTIVSKLLGVVVLIVGLIVVL
jgi:hypothetical protein